MVSYWGVLELSRDGEEEEEEEDEKMSAIFEGLLAPLSCGWEVVD